ncbi:MAG: hypothetical protein NZ898_17140, partial [Myxococcota bacterium]|nr:hypothetical protein [Myxococcota bacterium]MDW8364147.1 hypothetical protein [Myxococcales bacterium]
MLNRSGNTTGHARRAALARQRRPGTRRAHLPNAPGEVAVPVTAAVTLLDVAEGCCEPDFGS